MEATDNVAAWLDVGWRTVVMMTNGSAYILLVANVTKVHFLALSVCFNGGYGTIIGDADTWATGCERRSNSPHQHWTVHLTFLWPVRILNCASFLLVHPDFLAWFA